MAELIINGVAMPKVKGITQAREKIWSAKSGRATSGKYRGDLIGIKTTYEVEFGILTDAEAKKVDAELSKASMTVKARDVKTGVDGTFTMYAGTPTYPVYSYVEGYPRYTGTTVKLVEE